MHGRWFAKGGRGSRAARGERVELLRRGVHLGVVEVEREESCTRARALELWRRSRPILLRGILRDGVERHAASIRASREAFERFRRGASLQDFVWKRLARTRAFAPAGVTVDLGDSREIEKVFADAKRGARRVARDLYAKLSWISVDERDPSLRLRFSFGAEQLFEWFEDPSRSVHSDAFAAALYPECAVLERNAALRALIDACIGEPARLSERIVYNNAPGGGAIFHHDDEPWQRGVVYGQFAGETGWFALPKRELAELVAAHSRDPRLRAKPKVALRELDRDDAAELARLLNRSPRFARALVEHGAFLHLRAGDALLMPSHGPDDVCWHSVFALGLRPSLAHSYGIFGARRQRRVVRERRSRSDA